MNRVAIPEVSNLSLKNQIAVFKKVFENYHHWQGSIKYDGIFFSVGIDSDNQMYFQTANSPRMTFGYEYFSWAKHTKFGKSIADFADLLIHNDEFQRFVRINAAYQWPNEFCLNFEYFPHEYQYDHGDDMAITIRIPHQKNNSDVIIFHDSNLELREFPYYTNSFPILYKNPDTLYCFFSNSVGSGTYDALAACDFQVDTKAKNLKPLRDAIRKGIKDYFDSIDAGEDDPFEGVIFDVNDIKFKVKSKYTLEFTKLNPLIFGDKT